MPKQRTLFLTIALICLGLVGAALYLQHVKDMLPCPLCVIQRYLYLLVAAFCLYGAFGRKPRLALGLAFASALGGLGVVGKHLYVLAHPGFSCGIDPMETILNKVPTATLMPGIFRADGLCENATDTLFGLSIPAWSGVWFALLTVTLGLALLRRRP